MKLIMLDGTMTEDQFIQINCKALSLILKDFKEIRVDKEGSLLSGVHAETEVKKIYSLIINNVENNIAFINKDLRDKAYNKIMKELRYV
jgi:hypothetical protein